MSAEQLLKEGRLKESLDELQRQVRSDSANPKHRIFLFQMLAVRGEWTRALTQLDVAAEMDPMALAMAQMYREAIKCETLRRDVFAGTRSPLIFGEPPGWIGLLLESLRLLAGGELAASQKLRDQAFEEAEMTSGTLDGEPFEWIADADPRLGPVLEAIINGKYYWLPWQNLQKVNIEQPEDLRDFVWMPANFRFTNGGETVGLIPTRYPGSESSDDEAVCLARKTIWEDRGGDLFLGLGQRMFATDTQEHPLMDVREIILETADLAAGLADDPADDVTAEDHDG